MKTCTKCKIEKPFEEFYKNKISPDGHKSSCKECDKIRQQEIKKSPLLQLEKQVRSSIILENKLLSRESKRLCSKCNEIFLIDDLVKTYCKNCNIEYMNEYYEKNKDKIKEKSKEWEENNKDKIKEREKNYREKNKDKIKKYREKNKDKIREEKREYYLNNKNLFKEKMREYRKTEKGKMVYKNSNNKRRAKIREGNIKTEDLKLLIENSKTCYWCNTKINKKEKAGYHLDHYIPLSKGGTHTLENIVISCPNCNILKSNKDPYQFALEKGRLL